MSDIFQTTRHQIERHIRLPKQEAQNLKDNLMVCEAEITPDQDGKHAIIKVTGLTDDIVNKAIYYAGKLSGAHEMSDDISKIEKLGL